MVSRPLQVWFNIIMFSKSFGILIGLLLWAMPVFAGLQQDAESQKRTYGCAFSQDEFLGDGNFQAAVIRECASWTPTVGTKYSTIAGPNTASANPQLLIRDWDFSQLDWFRQQANLYGKKLRLTGLSWNKKVPPPVIQAKSYQEVYLHLYDYSYYVVWHGLQGANPVTSIDVIAEPFTYPGFWSNKLGLYGWAQAAFGGARQACNDMHITCELVLGEYGLETNRSTQQQILNYLDGLKARGIQVDAVSAEGHIDLNWEDYYGFGSFLRQVRFRGYSVFVDQMTVHGTNDSQIASTYTRFVKTCINNGVIKLITWGLSDKYKNPGMFTANERPLPLDVNMNPKPAYFALSNALKAVKSPH